MTVEEILKEFEQHPYLLSRGKRVLRTRLKSDDKTIEKAKTIYYNREKKLPKILIFDIETAPIRAFVWSLWKQDIAWNHTSSDWFILAWSAKWLYSSEVFAEHLTSEEAKNEDDSRILKKLWELVNEADIVVTHNGNRADIPWINTRFILNGMNPPTPYFSVDTCEVARRTFAFTSNKLDAIASYFGIDNKLETDFSLWVKCLQGDKKALEYMSIYNIKDVQILEEVYLKLRPWIKNHPNCGNLIDATIPTCASCGSENVELIEGQYYYTAVGKYQLYRCKDCGAISRGRKSILTSRPKLTSVGK